MHFDDRLATVLRLPSSGESMLRVQFRQLVDLLGRAPAAEDPGHSLDAGFARLDELEHLIPASDRARLLRQPLQPMCNPRLLARLAESEPDVASAAFQSARLDDDAWLDLIPALPVRARGILRHRRDMSPPVAALLDRLGVRDRALPPGPAQLEPAEPEPDAPIPDSPSLQFQAPTGNIGADQDISEDVLELLDMTDNPPPPTSLSEWAKARAQQQHRDLRRTTTEDPSRPALSSSEAGIGAIVRRIEAFRKAREAKGTLETGADSPRLPLGDGAPAPQRLALAIDFATDAEGRICWAEGPHAPSVIGLGLAAAHDPALGGAEIAPTMRQRLPLRAARIRMEGAPAVSGAWQVDAVPTFENARFTGYTGRLRRATVIAAAPAPSAHRADADRMREILHELRTPANAIQVAAEIIQQQLYGPAPHEYRALAAAIAGDCAHILAGFEELDRLVKLETGALCLEEGDCDLARVLAQTIIRLRAWTGPRSSGFELAGDPAAASLPVRVARSDVERLVWRLFAALAGSAAPGETLDLSWSGNGSSVEVTVALPSVLAERDDETLYDAIPGERGQSLATGMFGIGFTLRLAAAEAAAAGGSLQRVEEGLRLYLPALTEGLADNSKSATFSRY